MKPRTELESLRRRAAAAVDAQPRMNGAPPPDDEPPPWFDGNAPPDEPEGVQRRASGYTFAQACAAPMGSRYFCKRMIEPGAASLIFGDSGALKSFLASDLSAHIATGREWHGQRVKQAGVLVVLGEGQGGYRKRLRAWARHHDIDPATVRMYVCPRPVNLGNGIAELMAAIAEAEVALGCSVGVVLVDTLSTNLGDADEQSNSDLSRVFGNARRAVGEDRALLFVHHVGHADKGRERGGYQIRATADFRFLVERDGDIVTLTNPKAKEDIELPPMAFTFREIELGQDDDGDKIASLVIQPTDREPKKRPGKVAPTAKNQRVVFEVIGEMLRQSPALGQAGAPAMRPCIRVEEVAEACRGRLDVEHKRLRERVAAAVNGLVADGFLTMREGWLWVR